MLKPKIGIRPVIDGRWGGVRESLEEKTMNMAMNHSQVSRHKKAHFLGEQAILSAPNIKLPLHSV